MRNTEYLHCTSTLLHPAFTCPRPISILPVANHALGISLFLVPNVLSDSGTPNDVELISLNKKMGHRAITNCAWSLGERTGGAREDP